MTTQTFHAAMTVCAFVIPALAAEEIPQKEQLQKGVELHEKGDFDGAIAVYKAVLKENPKNVVAFYEMALTYESKGDQAQCIATVDAALKLPAIDPAIESNLVMCKANCLDESGRQDEAIKTYEAGIKKSPDDPQLLFNLAITRLQRGENAAARKLLQHDAEVAPLHASAHFQLAAAYAGDDYRAPAVLALMRYLTLDPSSRRSQVAATRLVAMLQESAGTPPAGSEDLRFVEALISPSILSARVAQAPEAKGAGELEKARISLKAIVDILADHKADQHAGVWIWSQYVPFFAELKEKGHLETFSYVALGTLDVPGGNDWLGKNDAKVKALLAWSGQKDAMRPAR
ncbi:MAG: tetratricopeptide repeat protein [Acidobacteriota bacterium]